MRRVFLLVVVSMAADEAFAQAERLGAVAGTWEACFQELQPLKRQVTSQEAKPTSPPSVIRYLKQRYTVELDRCVQLADAPLSFVAEVMQRHLELGVDVRALDIGLRTMSRTGAPVDVQRLVGQIFYKRGGMDRALPLLDDLVQRRNDPVAAELLGAHHYKLGDVTRALPYLRIVADARPNRFEPNAALGDACLAVHDLDCAGRYLARASELRSNDVLLAVKVGDLLRSRNDFGPAIEAYERAIAADPRRLVAHLGLGRALSAAELYESAAAVFINAAGLVPSDATPAIEASRVERRLGRPLVGVAMLDAHLSDKAQSEADLEYVLALLSAGQAKKALTRVADGAALTDNRWLAVNGDVQLANGNIKKALELYQRARRSAAAVEPYAVREARALRMLGKSADAVATLDSFKASEDPAVRTELVDAMLDVARAKVTEAQLAQAAAILTEASAIDPASSAVLAAAAAVADAAGDAAGAAALAAKLPQGPRRQALEAWTAYVARDYARAAMTSAAAGLRGHGPRLLRGAALAQAGQLEEASSVLASASEEPTQVSEWRGHVAIEACRQGLQASNATAAAGCAKMARGPVPAPFGEWLSRVPIVLHARGGGLENEDVAALKKLADRATMGAFEALALAYADSERNPEQALKRLRKMSDGPAVAAVRSHASMRLGASLFRKGKLAEARSTVKEVNRDRLSLADQLNREVIEKAQDAKALVKILAGFAEKGIPEAFYDLAVATDRVAASGADSIGPLSRFIEAAPSHPHKAAAERLLALKLRLYGKS